MISGCLPPGPRETLSRDGFGLLPHRAALDQMSKSIETIANNQASLKDAIEFVSTDRNSGLHEEILRQMSVRRYALLTRASVMEIAVDILAQYIDQRAATLAA